MVEAFKFAFAQRLKLGDADFNSTITQVSKLYTNIALDSATEYNYSTKVIINFIIKFIISQSVSTEANRIAGCSYDRATQSDTMYNNIIIVQIFTTHLHI